VELIVVGAHGTWPSAGGATSGFLVRHEGFTILLDMGSGTVAKIQEHIGLFDLDAVVISHSHPDHVVDLYTYLFARMFSPERPPPIPLFVAPKVVERMSPLLEDDSGPMLKLAQGFDVRPVEPGDRLDTGPFRIEARKMSHTVPTVGVRLEADGMALAYTADTGPTEELQPLARDAGLLIADASWQEDGEPRPPIHMTAREAGQAAAAAGSDALILAHLRPYLDRDRSREEAAGAYGGPVHMASEGLRMEVR
jgi:ribonuclease BN (tRNA processing enzyme)